MTDRWTESFKKSKNTPSLLSDSSLHHNFKALHSVADESLAVEGDK